MFGGWGRGRKRGVRDVDLKWGKGFLNISDSLSWFFRRERIGFCGRKYFEGYLVVEVKFFWVIVDGKDLVVYYSLEGFWDRGEKGL